jgi:mRNA degradation ribonuclease J1/J2
MGKYNILLLNCIKKTEPNEVAFLLEFLRMMKVRFPKSIEFRPIQVDTKRFFLEILDKNDANYVHISAHGDSEKYRSGNRGKKTRARIYSSSEAHSEEDEYDFQRLNKWLNHFNLTPKGFHMKDDKPVFEKGYHASGHLSQEDLTKVIDDIDPDKIIPIHTQHPEWFKETFDKTIIIPSDGRINL